MATPRPVPGPNAFAQRQSVVPGPNAFAIAKQRPYAREYRSSTQSVQSRGSMAYSPSVYSDAEGRLSEETPPITPLNLRRSGSTDRSSRSSSESVKRPTFAPPPRNTPYHEILKEQASQDNLNQSSGRFNNDSRTPKSDRKNKFKLQTITEVASNPSLVGSQTKLRLEPPKPLDLKLAKSFGEAQNAEKRAISDESIKLESERVIDTGSIEAKKNFFERLRGPQTISNGPASKADRKIPERDRAIPSIEMPRKAGKILGDRLDIPKKAAKFFGALPNQPGTTPTRLPSFGQLGLPEPDPPFASESVIMPRIHGDSNASTPTIRNFTSRMMRQSSDPRLLLLNDRIAANTDDKASLSPGPFEIGHALSPTTERPAPPPKSPPKSPNTLRHIDQRLPSTTYIPAQQQRPQEYPSSTLKPNPQRPEAIAREEASSIRNFGTICGIKPTVVEGDDDADALSEYGSLHGPNSDENSSGRQRNNTSSPPNNTGNVAYGINGPSNNGSRRTNNSTTTYTSLGSTAWPFMYSTTPEPDLSEEPGPCVESSEDAEDTLRLDATNAPRLIPSPLHLQQRTFSREEKQGRARGLTLQTLTGVEHDTEHSMPTRAAQQSTAAGSPEDLASHERNKPSLIPEISSVYNQYSGLKRWSSNRSRPATPRSVTPRQFNTHASTSTAPAPMLSNQPWTSGTTPTANNIESSLLRDILARMDSQRDGIWELKGQLAGNTTSTDSQIAKLSSTVESMNTNMNQLSAEVQQLRELLNKTIEAAVTPTLTQSSGSRMSAESKESPRRHKRSHPPISFPSSLGPIPDMSPMRPQTPLYSPYVEPRNPSLERQRSNDRPQSPSKRGSIVWSDSKKTPSTGSHESSTSNRYPGFFSSFMDKSPMMRSKSTTGHRKKGSKGPSEPVSEPRIHSRSRTFATTSGQGRNSVEDEDLRDFGISPRVPSPVRGGSDKTGQRSGDALSKLLGKPELGWNSMF